MQKVPQILGFHQVQVLYAARLQLQRYWRGYRARQRCQQRRQALRKLQWLGLVAAFYSLGSLGHPTAKAMPDNVLGICVLCVFFFEVKKNQMILINGHFFKKTQS